MDKDNDLPASYHRYFELRRQGHELSEIADELGIPEDAMDAFIVLAHAKLTRQRSHDPSGDRPS